MDADHTLQQSDGQTPQNSKNDLSCLVQIYPPDVIDGMLVLENRTLVIGRDLGADLVLDDPNVSRRHAELVPVEDGVEIIDLDSTNGVMINNAEVDRRVLSSGDTIGIGGYIFRYLSAGSIETQYHETVYTALVRDALTGTMNKRYLMESMSRELARAIRQKAPLSVIMLDIDHFKSVNDTHGHLVGDEVLKEFGRRILSIAREDDLLARYGGEEFCLLLAGTELDEACEVAERCRQIVDSTAFQTEVGDLSVSASFGVACLDPAHPISCDEILELADQKLYQAKAGGRNQVCG